MTRVSATAVLVGLVLSATPSWAQPNYFWNGSNGSFADSSRWSFGVVTPAGPPAAGDRALFLTGSTYTVTGNGSPAQVIVQSPLATFTGVIAPQGNVTGFPSLTTGFEVGTTALGRASFTGSGAALNSARPVSVGESAEGTLIFGQGAQGTATFFGTSASVSVAGNPAGIGHLLIGGVNTTFTATGTFLLGSRGIGDVSVTVDGTLNTNGILASNQAGLNIGGSIPGATGALGTLTIGSGGKVVNKLQTNIGLYGQGTVNISGGTFTSTDEGTNNPAISIARFAESAGHLNVSGTGHVIAQGHLIVGGDSAGDMTIADNGFVETLARVNVPAIVGLGSSANGLATIDGIDAQWTVTNALVVAQLGTGVINIKNGGTLFLERTDLVNDPFLHIADDAGSNGTVKVTDEFSFLDASLITTKIGADAFSTGRLEIANLGKASLARTSVGSSGTGTLDLKTGGQLISGTALIGDQSGSSGTATLTTNSSWHVGGQLYVGADGAGNLVVNNATTLTVDEFISVGDGFNGTGTMTIDGPTALVNGALSTVYLGYGGQGELRLVNGSNWSVMGDATLGEIADGVGIASVDATSSWSLTGGIAVGGSPTLAGGEGQLNITGTVTAGTNVKVWDEGVATLISGGNLNATQVNVAGKLAGFGTVTAVITTNGGIVAPDHGVVATGQLTITGAYTQTAAGKLQMELGGTSPGTDFDKLAISGAATLAGALEVSLVSGFMPALGQSFDLLDWGSVSGTFNTLILPSLSVGLAWNTAQLYATGALSVVSGSPCAVADVNGDSRVDGADLSVLYSNWGTATVGTPGNLNGDNVVDGADLATVYTCWTGDSASSAAVPEPAGFGIVAIGFAGLIAIRRR